jgi:hypothetical protein
MLRRRSILQLFAFRGASIGSCGTDETLPAGTGGSGGSAGGDGSAGTAGTNGASGSSGSAGSGGVSWPNLACDPIVPSYCAFPFPSNVFTVADSTSPTGRRVRLRPDTLPVAASGTRVNPAPWDKSDGFSPGAALLAHFPGVRMTGLPAPNTLASSLEAACPTVLLDAATGERVPHFAELDRSGDNDAERAFMIRPAVRLKDAARYIVAIRDLQGENGPIEPSPAFKALRDGSSSSEPSVESRRGLYADIFRRLSDAGVAKDDLILAWDFTTASRENNTAWMVHMRDEALRLVGESGPAFTIDTVETTYEPTQIAFRVNGKMTVPLYLDKPEPGASLIFGSDGMPEPNATTPTYEVPFEVLIPQSAKMAPAALVAYGHGLLGDRKQIEAGGFRSLMNQYNLIFFAVDLSGFAGEDTFHIAGTVGSGEFDKLSTMYDRMHQGTLNHLLAMRMMSRRFAQDPTYGSYVKADERYYYGISQGGIFGGVYMALSTDVVRGALDVMGQPYNLLLNRSVDFAPFFDLLNGAFPNSLDQQFVLDLTQMLWDRVEPNGYSPYIRQNMLPGTPAHEVLMTAAVGDHQVTTIGGQLMARSVGAVHLDTGIRDVYGLTKVTNRTTGSAYAEYDFGLPPEPLCNIPMDACADPHGKLRAQEPARRQIEHFLRTGEIVNYCDGGSCKFPALSGCAAGATTPPCGGQ